MPWSTLPVSEEEGSRRENWTVDGMNASVTLRCAWDIRHSVALDIVGNRNLYISAPGSGGPFASSAGILPGDTNCITTGQELSYETALVTIGYDNRQPEDVFSESLEPNIDALTTKPENMVWGTDTAADGEDLADTEAPTKLFRSLNFVQTRFNVEPPLSPVYLTAIGGVNDAPYVSQSLGLTFAAETLLFTPPSINRVITTAGAGAYTITSRFTYKPQGWNVYWNSDLSTWRTIWIKANPDATPPTSEAKYKGYPLKDFSALLA